jgi:c-di-GMP-binding flagellar brake protein YcgR
MVWPQAATARAMIVTERVVTARFMTKSFQQRGLNVPRRRQFRISASCKTRLSGEDHDNSRDRFQSADINRTPSPCRSHESQYSNRAMH